jgi:hypothetical protein
MNKMIQMGETGATKASLTSWLNRAFLDWASKEGRRKTVREFAAYIGISEIFVGKWMRGEREPRNSHVIVLANKLGDEIYDILGWPRPSAGTK